MLFFVYIYQELNWSVAVVASLWSEKCFADTSSSLGSPLFRMHQLFTGLDGAADTSVNVDRSSCEWMYKVFLIKQLHCTLV